MSGVSPAEPEWVVEIVGACGSGKSTLTRAVTDHDPAHQLEEFLQFKKLDHLRSAAHSVPGLANLLVAGLRARRLPDVTELKLIIYLMVWHHRIRRSPVRGTRAVVVDQGPVYALATLRRTNPPLPGTEPAGRWWRTVLAQWATTLDVIVWLDAPDDVLWERVQNRSEEHEIKGGPKESGIDFIKAYRDSFESTLEEFDHVGGPRIMRFNTSHWTTERMVTEILERLAGSERSVA